MELCDEAILTLEGAASSMGDGKGTMYSDLASANTWRHLMSDVDPISVGVKICNNLFLKFCSNISDGFIM